MTGIALGFIAVTVFVTAVISGVFGMAGGIILMAVLLSMMPVPAAMSLHAIIQTGSNGWRCWLWRDHIVWRTLPFYGAGALTGLLVVTLVTFVPDKATAFIVMGSLPLLSLAARRYIHITITNPFHAYSAATILTFIQMTGGVVGPLLDVLYNNAALTRQQIISTKAFTQTAMHLMRLFYYTAILSMMGAAGALSWGDIFGAHGVGIGALTMLVGLAVAGATAATYFVRRMDDALFKRLGNIIITMIALSCLAQGFYLLWQEHGASL